LALLIGLSVVLGAIIMPLAGVAVCAAGVLGVVLIEFSSKEGECVQSLREASRSMPLKSVEARTRILVVANHTVGSEGLKTEILKRGEPRPELRIVVPVLCSRAHYLTSDIDREIAAARTRLEATLRWARGLGFEVTGAVGDANPLVAIEDELHRFGADELIVSTRTPERSQWLEVGIVERARSELEVPVTHVVVDVSGPTGHQLERAA
jgi:hypothetical protein